MTPHAPTLEQINRSLTAVNDAMCKLSQANAPIAGEMGPRPLVYYKINQAWRLVNECWEDLEVMRKARQ
jgi:hypothetical protein